MSAGYESTNTDPNGDGRAQCAVGNDFEEPFNVTIYADDGSVYKLDPNEVSTPGPDYAGQGFFNDTYYPIGSGSLGEVGPADLDGFCDTDPAPNVDKGGDTTSSTETTSTLSSGSSLTESVSSGPLTSTASVPSGSSAVSQITGTGTGYAVPTGGSAPSGSIYHVPSTPSPSPFTGDASVERISVGVPAFFGAIVVVMNL